MSHRTFTYSLEAAQWIFQLYCPALVHYCIYLSNSSFLSTNMPCWHTCNFWKRFYKIWWWRKIAAKFNNLYFVFRNIHLFTFLYANKISSFRGLAQNIKCISMIGSPCTESWNSFSWKIHKLGGNEFNLL